MAADGLTSTGYAWIGLDHFAHADAARRPWAFAGSGRFDYAVRWTWRGATRVEFTVAGCPICRDRSAAAPQCTFYAAAFERLQRTLVDDRYRVAEVECVATGGRSCRFVARRR